MDSDSELSISEQITLVKMLMSDDIESTRLALSLIDSYKKPGIFINYPENLISDNSSYIVVRSFFQYVRRAAEFELSLPPDDWDKENEEMLKRLSKY